MCALYVLEKQPHIPQLQLYVSAAAANTALSIQETSITLRISPPTRLKTGCDDAPQPEQAQSIIIPLDCRVKMAQPPTAVSAGTTSPAPASLSITKAANACLIRISLHRAYTDATSSLSPSLPSAFELQPTSYPTLFCRRCLSPLLTDPPVRVKPLPSSHWSELTDLWYCHNTNDNSHLDHLIQHAVRAKQHTLLVGREEVRLDSGGVRGVRVGEAVVREVRRERTKRQQCGGHAHHAHSHEEVKEERKEQEQQATGGHSVERVIPLPSLLYRQACCERCEAELGWCVSESSAASNESEVWLHKHRITNVLPSDTDGEAAAQCTHPLLSALSSLNVSSASTASDSAPSTSSQSVTTPAATVPSLFLRHYTVETYLSSQLLSLCEARCSFRFVVRPLSSPSGGSGRHLHIVLLNVDTAIRCPATAKPNSDGEMQPVLKVAYSTCEADVAQCKGEVVELSAADMAEVELVLQRQSEWLPVEFRHMEKQTLSYLRRLTSD